MGTRARVLIKVDHMYLALVKTYDAKVAPHCWFDRDLWACSAPNLDKAQREERSRNQNKTLISSLMFDVWCIGACNLNPCQLLHLFLVSRSKTARLLPFHHATLFPFFYHLPRKIDETTNLCKIELLSLAICEHCGGVEHGWVGGGRSPGI